MQEELKVVILSSDNKSDIITWGKHLKKSSGKIKDDYDIAFAICAKYQQLYFISDEEIKKGDWAVILTDEKPIIVNVKTIGKEVTAQKQEGGYIVTHTNFLKKIIATTDTSLKRICPSCNGRGQFDNDGYNQCKRCKTSGEINLPRPSEKWIEYFITEWNKSNQIEKVMVEYHGTHISGAYDIEDMFEFGGYDIEKLIINSDNTINIELCKKKE
jgi:hypothetical protein